MPAEAPTPSSTDAAASASSTTSWSDEEIESLILTALAVAVVTALLYRFILRPAGGDDGVHGAQRQPPQPAHAPRRAAGALGGARGTRPMRNGRIGVAGSDGEDESGVLRLLQKSARHPPHLKPPAAKTPAEAGTSATNLSGLVGDGVVPFRHTLAAAWETSLAASAAAKMKNKEGEEGAVGGEGNDVDDDPIVFNRRERARVFARLFASSSSGDAVALKQPPHRGSNAVVSIRQNDVGCARLRRALFLLGTYYNLFVVLVLPPEREQDGAKDVDARLDDLRRSLRGNEDEKGVGVGRTTDDERCDDGGDGMDCQLPEAVLPSHRIVAATSAGGRIAFVRQLLPRPDVVLDYDTEVKSNLVRFGFDVLLYPDDGGGRDNAGGKGGSSIPPPPSSLGRMLLP